MKLKTLKDLKTPKLKVEFLDKNKLCSRVELKQEAIKWIKELKKDYSDEISRKIFKGLITKEDYKGAILILARFFNITEEDLK